MGKHGLKATLHPVQRLAFEQKRQMYDLFCHYYENHTFDQFLSDLSEKNDVILLQEKKTNTIQGFSTILKKEIIVDNKKTWAVFSGDTVLNKEFWGSPALGIQFLIYLWKLKIKCITRPVYWFLISKGYKTYLLMANNFSEHYPRYEKPTPAFEKKLMLDFYGSKFSDTYSAEKDLIQPLGHSCKLKISVADISFELLKNPRIAFFQCHNPDWQKGSELCCIAKMSLFLPIHYAVKKLFKRKSAWASKKMTQQTS